MLPGGHIFGISSLLFIGTTFLQLPSPILIPLLSPNSPGWTLKFPFFMSKLLSARRRCCSRSSWPSARTAGSSSPAAWSLWLALIPSKHSIKCWVRESCCPRLAVQCMLHCCFHRCFQWIRYFCGSNFSCDQANGHRGAVQ